jgi:pimeloyl-ACP methyl ester carboxylesterase
MFDERAFIAKVEAADADELVMLFMRPSIDEEKALRAHLGDERYQRMHSLALKRKVSRSVTAQPKGNVVVIHGIMGGELKVSSGGDGDLAWVNAFRIFRGWLDRLRLSDDGRTDANPKFKVTASGIMKRSYGELILSLAQQWNVKPFWFDWRKDLDLAADELNRQINGWFDNNAPVHIVAHSMGGLVARTFIKKYGGRWKTMWDRDGNGKAGGRLVMLGTPNQGSFAIPQVITGLEDIIRKIALVDIRHSVHDLLATFNSFVGSYQMLPSPLAMPAINGLYNSGTYSRFNVNVPQPHLDNALVHHQWLQDVLDFDRMIYIAGYDQPTFCNVSDWTKLDKTEGYQLTQAGDGRVPHELGLLFSPDKKQQVLTYYIKENHGNLSTNPTILTTLDQLLETGTTTALPTQIPAGQRGKENQRALRAQYDKARLADEDQLLTSLRRMNTRGLAPNQEDDPIADDQNQFSSAAPELISPEERKVEEAVTRGFLASQDDEQSSEADFDADKIEHAKIEIGLVHGGIESIDYESIRSRKKHAIDAIAVGHYIGVQPQQAELALDRAISAALGAQSDDSRTSRSDLILTQYTERGLIEGKLGQPFMMPDPRPPKNHKSGTTGRLIVLAGMNEPGSFGIPELNLLARELCWSLGRLNKLHLATVMIGSGDGNLALRDTVSGWLSGIRRAVSGSVFDEGRRLQRITFVEKDPRRVIQLDRLIKLEKQRNDNNNSGFEIDYQGFSDAEVADLKKQAYQAAKQELERQWKSQELPQDVDKQIIPARIAVSLDVVRKTYHFGAITETAAVPERDIVIDPSLIWQANDELAAEQAPSMQLERGRFLEKLLMPQDLRKQLYTRAPLVMLLDATMARIHWEMVAQPALGNSSTSARAAAENKFEYEEDFLGTSRGFTRQLRTNFAPPPEPPPPPQKILRVLVVADPAADAHLPGAQEEGVMVAELFDSYNVLYEKTRSTTRIEVKRLFGPIEATRGNVLRELMERSYDVLHFAGHCVYQWDGDPGLSGWIFNMSNKELLTANELYRVDRIPKFVFSNACESGVTPDRAQDRSDKLAPSFAEAFFARGVANFVCTAWPVDDVAARTFALSLYAGLLGIELEASGAAAQDGKKEALPMHDAMRKARLAIAKTSNGRTTWGAYQHYGNPYFQFFYSTADTESQTKGRAAADPIKRRKRRAPGAKKSGARTRKRGRQ